MTNDHDVRRNFDDLAELAYSLDAGRVIARAERRRRRRTTGVVVIAATLTATATAAVTAITGPDTPQRRSEDAPAVSATQAPSIMPTPLPSSPRPYRGTAGPGVRVDYLDPLPGTPAGDAALERTTFAEVRRRCALRGADAEALRPNYPEEFRAGLVLSYPPDHPKAFPLGDPTGCLVPGDSKPTTAGLAAYRTNPIPTDTASRLGNCSVALWHDVRGWRVIASDEAPGREIRMVLRSPSGDHVAECRLISRYTGPFPAVEMIRNVGIFPNQPLSPEPKIGDNEFEYGPICSALDDTMPDAPLCTGRLRVSTGQTRSDAARVVLTSKTGATHELTVVDGWYALAWIDPSPDVALGRVVVYNAAGEVIYRR